MVLAKQKKQTYSNKKKSKKVKRQNKDKINNKLRIKLSILLYSVLVTCVFIFLLSRYTHITELQMQVSKTNKEISKIEEKKNLLLLELEEIKDSGWVEDQAKIRMNMRKANMDQIVYVDVKSD